MVASIKDSHVLDGIPDLRKRLLAPRGQKPQLKRIVKDLHWLCRKGYSIRCVSGESLLEALYVMNTFPTMRASKQDEFGWGRPKRAKQVFCVEIFRYKVKGRADCTGYLASCEREWVEEELREAEKYGFQVGGKSWEP